MSGADLLLYAPVVVFPGVSRLVALADPAASSDPFAVAIHVFPLTLVAC